MLKEKVRIAVLVSGGGTNLQALIDAQNRGDIESGEIALVLSSKEDAYALERGAGAGIPCETITKKACGSPEAFDAKLVEVLKAHGIELVVLAGFMSILGPRFIAAYRDRIINVHPSLIPSFCGKGYYGLRVHEAALAYGVKLTGATVHYVNEIPDGGRIILQKAVEIEAGDTPEMLQERVMRQAEWVILPRATEMVAKQILMERSAKQ